MPQQSSPPEQTGHLPVLRISGGAQNGPIAGLERLQQKWSPALRPDTRENKNLEQDDVSKISLLALERLDDADAFRPSLDLAQREAIWAIRALRDNPLPLFAKTV